MRVTDHRYDFTLPDRHYLGLDPARLPFRIEKTVAFVPRLGLCTMCGGCEGVCPEDAVAMTFNNQKGILEPQVNAARCTDCELCVRVCPGFELDLEAHLTPELRAETTASPHFGRFAEIFRMRSADPWLARGGSSGGMVTATLAYLLESGRIDGALVTRMKPGSWSETESYLARDIHGLVPSQKSKYLPNPMDRVLKHVIRGDISEQRLAFIGLPCHVEALRLAQRAFPVLAERIGLILSIFCSRTPSLHATEFLLHEHGVRPEEVRTIEYRSGHHPGHLTIQTNRGDEVQVGHLHWSYWGFAFNQFFYPTRCFACFDKTGEQANLSFGDNWSRVGSEQLGASTVIARSVVTAELMREMAARGRASISNTMSAEELIADQDLIRKRLIGNRLWWMRRLGRKIPIYYDRIELERRSLLRTLRMVRHVLMAEHHLPPAVMGLYIRLSYGKRRLTARFRSAIERIGGMLSRLAIRRHPLHPPADEYRVVVIGGFGWRDIGDESMPRADVLRLRSRCPELSVVMLSPDPAYTEAYHGERSMPDLRGVSWGPDSPGRERAKCLARAFLVLAGAAAQRCGLGLRLWPNARGVLDELAQADLLFNVGGGNINSVIPSELYRKCTEHLAARILGLPVVVSGQTIGPFSRRLDRLVARLALDRVQMITLRDSEVSRRRLRDIGVRRPQIADTGDDALGLPALAPADARRLLARCVPQAWTDINAPMTAAVNLKGSLRVFKGEGRNGGLGHEVELFAGIVNWLIETWHARVLLVPTDYGEGVDDRELHREIATRAIDRARVACVEDELKDVELKALIGQTDVAIGARYHFCVFAAAERVAFLGLASGLYQQTKLEGLANLLGLDECYVPLDAEYVALDQVLPYLEAVVTNRARIAADLNERVPGLVEASATAVNFAVERLHERRGIA